MARTRVGIGVGVDVDRICRREGSVRSQRLNRASALGGGGIWLAALTATMMNVWPQGLIALLLLLAVLVVVPLGLALIDPPQRMHGPPWWQRAAASLQPVAAFLVLISLALPVGILAALLASSWLLFAGLAAAIGLTRLRSHGLARLCMEEVCIDAALAFLPVGAIWLVCSRAGLQPGGFREPIVLLTAVHFHYAGFGAVLLAGRSGRALRSGPSIARRGVRLASFGVIGALPLVALSFARWPVVETAGVLLLSASLLLLSMCVLLVVAPGIHPPLARALLLLSAIAPIVPMLLASIYSWGLLTGDTLLTIPQMARLHGTVNAVGFVLCGLLVWTFEHRATSRPSGAG